MRDALAKAGKTNVEIVVYPDAGHGFHADYRSSYNAADAMDGWSRMLAFFAKNGVAPRPYHSGLRPAPVPGFQPRSLCFRISRSLASWASAARNSSIRRTA